MAKQRTELVVHKEMQWPDGTHEQASSAVGNDPRMEPKICATVRDCWHCIGSECSDVLRMLLKILAVCENYVARLKTAHPSP